MSAPHPDPQDPYAYGVAPSPPRTVPMIPRANQKGFVALVLAGLAVFLMLVNAAMGGSEGSMVGVYAWVSLAAVVFGVLGVVAARRYTATNVGVAMAGLLIGGAMVVLNVLGIVMPELQDFVN